MGVELTGAGSTPGDPDASEVTAAGRSAARISGDSEPPRGLAMFVHQYGYPLRALVKRDFQVRYAQTMVGVGWAVLQPLTLLLLYTFVFSVILQLKFRAGDTTGDFALYLTCGMFPFLALMEGVQRASTSLSDNRGLLDKVRFPSEVLPAVGVVSGAVTEVIGLALLTVVAGVFFGVRPSLWMLVLPVLMGMRMLLTMGIAWLVSVLNVFFTDLGQVVGLMLTAWMFLTPVFYPVEMVPDQLMWAVRLNPLHHLVEGYRSVILGGSSPLSRLPVLALWSVGLAVLGWRFFRKTIESAKDFL